MVFFCQVVDLQLASLLEARLPASGLHSPNDQRTRVHGELLFQVCIGGRVLAADVHAQPSC